MASFPLPSGEPALYANTNGGFTAPTLSSWQFEYNGLTMGGSSPFMVKQAEGFGELPTVGSHDVAFPRDTGEWQGVDAMGGRDPILDLECTTNIFTEFVSLGKAVAVNPFSVLPLWFQVPTLEVLCSMCRPRKRTTPWDFPVAAAEWWRPTLTFHANDPRFYGAGQVASCSSGSGSVSLTVDNAGNCEMRPVIVLTGPLTAPAVQNTSVPGTPSIVFQSGTSIASGDQVVIDLDPSHLVTYYVGGISSPSSRVPVYNWLDFSSTRWWNLPSGSNDLTCSATGSIASGAFQVWFSSAYLF